MISVLPCRDSAKIKELFTLNKLTVNEYSGCVIAEQNGEMLGYCLYDLTQKAMTVFVVEPQNDVPLADGILRSALHVAAENFVLDAFYAECAPIELFRLLNFIKNEDEKRLNIDMLFGGCTCDNKK